MPLEARRSAEPLNQAFVSRSAFIGLWLCFTGTSSHFRQKGQGRVTQLPENERTDFVRVKHKRS
jgi:hypothetical protein